MLSESRGPRRKSFGRCCESKRLVGQTVLVRRRFLCFTLLTIILANKSQNSSTVRMLAPRNNPTWPPMSPSKLKKIFVPVGATLQSFIREAPPRGSTSYPFKVYHFKSIRYPFRIPSTVYLKPHKRTPFGRSLPYGPLWGAPRWCKFRSEMCDTCQTSPKLLRRKMRIKEA